VFFRGVDPLIRASVSTRCAWIEADDDNRVGAAARTVQPTRNLQVITALAVHRTGSQRHADAGDHQVERPVNLQVWSNHSEPLVALVDEQRRVTRHRRQSCRKPILCGSRSRPANRRRAAAGEIRDHNALVESVRHEHAAIGELANSTDLCEVDGENAFRSLQLEGGLNGEQKVDDHWTDRR